MLARGVVLAAGTREATRRAVAAVAPHADRIDATGKWVLPGLVDAHVHMNALADASAVLRAGATAVRSGSSTFYQDVALRPLAKWAPGTTPRTRAAGVFVSPELGDAVLADPHLAPLAALPNGVQATSDLRYLTRVNLSRGVDVVKTRPTRGRGSRSRTRRSWSTTGSRSRRSSRLRGAPGCCATPTARPGSTVRSGPAYAALSTASSSATRPWTAWLGTGRTSPPPWRRSWAWPPRPTRSSPSGVGRTRPCCRQRCVRLMRAA